MPTPHLPAPVRVAHVPADHPYVRHLLPLEPDGTVEALPEPGPPGVPDGRWWPSQVLEIPWLRACAATFDVVHVHFGFEHRTPAQLHDWCGALAELGKPLVLTVHDLDNPHLRDQTGHRANLDVLVRHASVVLSLTEGAAAEVRRRWGRDCLVVPHPHVVGLQRMALPRPAHDDVRVALLAKPRANSDPAAIRPELRRATAELGITLEPELDRRVPEAELWDTLSALDVLVLPYVHGTHSGFVEACFDLGTAVVAPRVGFLAEQHQVFTYDLAVPGSLTATLWRAVKAPPARADPARRAAERNVVAAVHRRLYHTLTARAVAA